MVQEGFVRVRLSHDAVWHRRGAPARIPAGTVADIPESLYEHLKTVRGRNDEIVTDEPTPLPEVAAGEEAATPKSRTRRG